MTISTNSSFTVNVDINFNSEIISGVPACTTRVQYYSTSFLLLGIYSYDVPDCYNTVPTNKSVPQYLIVTTRTVYPIFSLVILPRH